MAITGLAFSPEKREHAGIAVFHARQQLQATTKLRVHTRAVEDAGAEERGDHRNPVCLVQPRARSAERMQQPPQVHKRRAHLEHEYARHEVLHALLCSGEDEERDANDGMC